MVQIEMVMRKADHIGAEGIVEGCHDDSIDDQPDFLWCRYRTGASAQRTHCASVAKRNGEDRPLVCVEGWTLWGVLALAERRLGWVVGWGVASDGPSAATAKP